MEEPEELSAENHLLYLSNNYWLFLCLHTYQAVSSQNIS